MKRRAGAAVRDQTFRNVQVVALVLLAGAVWPHSARAYRTAADLPDFTGTERVRWRSDEIPYVVHSTEFPGNDAGVVSAAVAAGVEGWSRSLCTSHGAVVLGSASTSVDGDGVVMIRWSNTEWASLGFPADALGLTDILYEQGADGVWFIGDAEIRFNGVDYQWSPTAGAPESADRSIEAAVAHEWGHVIGMIHPCEPGGVGGPDCATSPAYADTTMYPYYTGPQQATLSSDDEAGACFLYPSAATCPTGVDCATACNADLCTATLLVQGDLCFADGECASQVCHQGYCTSFCGIDGCSAGFVCERPDDPAAICLPVGAVYGENCVRGEGCVSNLCLVADASQGLCSRECQPNGICPNGDRCQSVEGRTVCVPGAVAVGCTLAGIHPARPSSGLLPSGLIPIALFVLLRVFRARGIR